MSKRAYTKIREAIEEVRTMTALAAIKFISLCWFLAAGVFMTLLLGDVLVLGHTVIIHP